MAEILAIKIFHGESVMTIEKKDCHYIKLGFMSMYSGENIMPINPETTDLRSITGIWYKMNAAKWPIPIQELDIFVPMTSVVQIAFK